MNRCMRSASALFSIAACALLAWASTSFYAEVQAQESVREFPRVALRGLLEVVAPPDVRLDGRADRLSPGARIFGPQNQLVMSGAIVGQPLTVNYTRDGAGLLREVWILNATEATLKRPGGTPERNFAFESDAQKAPHDDGKTPYNQLPAFPKR